MLPSGTIYLCKGTNLKLDSSECDTIYFSSATEKREWFASKVAKTFSNQNYTRMGGATETRSLNGERFAMAGEGIIRIGVNIGEINMCDYMYFIEPNYENRYFYCFITCATYVNDNVTEVHFVEDAFMTWCHSMYIDNSFVVRETTSTDNKYDELFDQEDFTNDGTLRTFSYTNIAKSMSEANVLCVVTNMAVDNFGLGDTHELSYALHNGRADNLCYWFTRTDYSTGMVAFGTLINHQQTDNSWSPLSTTPAYRVISVFLISRLALPDAVIDKIDGLTSGSYSTCTVSPNGSSDFDSSSALLHLSYQNVQQQDFPISLSSIENNAFGSYTPRNNKMYSAPYIFLRVKNNWGECIDLEPQHLTKFTSGGNTNVLLRTIGTFFTEESVNLYPAYEGSYNTSYRLHKTNAPQVPFNYDTYQQWLSQNKLSLALTGARSIINAFSTYYGSASIATVPMNKGGRGIPTYSYVSHQLGATSERISGYGESASMIGGTIGTAMSVRAQGVSTAGTNSADISSRAEDNDCFTYEVLSISETDARTVDDYFTKFGYAINRLKSITLGLNGRSKFHYIQTENASVNGDIPMYAKQIIRGLFDNGIRMWNKDRYLDYSGGNPLS